MNHSIRRPLFSVIALMSVTSTAFAGGNGDYGHQPTQPTGTTYNATVNNTALAGALANSRSSSASNSHSASTSTSAATGGRSNARATGGNSSVNNSGVNVNNSSGNGHSYNTPDAIAPSINGGNTCAVGGSGALSFAGIGLGGGYSGESKSCALRQEAALLYNMGFVVEAKNMLCEDTNYSNAFARSGHPCAADVQRWMKQGWKQ